MREIVIGIAEPGFESGERGICEYSITIMETGGLISFENYGVKVRVQATGEEASIHNITLSLDRITELGQCLCRNEVTPCTLSDVVEDWL